ncbi:MAG: hypothetical protein V4478_01430, partial [Patescibacteria group bacterium]
SWQKEQGTEHKTIKKGDVIHAWNKAARLARRSWYVGLRYSKQARLWGNKRAVSAFMSVFPRSKAAFVEQDMLTGLEHGASSYFLATLSKPTKKPRAKAAPRKKKLMEIVPENHLSEE